MKRRILQLLLVVSLGVFGGASVADIAAQGSPSGLAAAVEAFEGGEFERTIELLAAYEKSNGTSPRLESLRALAYRDLEKPKEAHQAVLVYLRLTANRDMSGSEAHHDMVKLRDEMLEAIEKKYKDDKEKLDKERDEVATSVVEELESFYSSPQIKRSYSSALPASLKTEADDPPGEYIGPPPSASKTAAPGMDGLAELEMWRKINQSTVAMDYFLFIESFPNGQFTEIARKKMHEIGDRVWNEVRKGFDPFKYRDYINANPDSPFIEVAKVRMDELARVAIDWEQVRDSRDPSKLRAFEARNPGHGLAAESKKIRAEIAWRNIENLSSPAVFRDFIKEHPESPYVSAAQAALDKLGVPGQSGGLPPEVTRSFSPSGDPAADINLMADNFLISRSFRSKTVIVIPGQPQVSTTMEFVAPDRFRIVNANGPETRIIGKDYYSDASGRWEKMPANLVANAPDMRSTWDKKGRDQLSDAKYVGEETVNGKPTHVYTAFARGIDGAGANDSKFWIAKSDGRPVRMEAIYKSGILKSMTIDYEYDPGISIELPANGTVVASPISGSASVGARSNVGFAKFNDTTYRLSGSKEDEKIWTVFETTGPCTAKAIVSNSIVTQPVRDEIDLNLSDVAVVRVKDGAYKSWVIEVEHRNDEFWGQQSVYTRKPKWDRVQFTRKLRFKKIGILVLGDRAKADETAAELEQLIAQCKK